jgi:hypothetical protein
VAKIGKFYVSEGDLNKDVEAFNALVSAQGLPQAKIDTKEKKMVYLRNDIVRRYILYQEGLDRGLDKKQDIVRALESTKVSLVVAELLRQETEKIAVSSKEIEDFYNQNKDLMSGPEERKILEIVTPTENEAKDVYIELLKGGDFAALARQYSKAPSASKGGDLGYIRPEVDPAKRSKFDKFYEVAFAPSLEANDISSIFKGPEGFYIIKVEGIRKPEAHSLSQVWDNIKSLLMYEKQQKAVAGLADKLAGQTKIEVYEGEVK